MKIFLIGFSLMAAPTIPLYTGTEPNRNQSANDFADNADDWLAYQAPLATDYNDLATYLDALSVSVQGIADDAQNSADDAQASAIASDASATESASSATTSQSNANFEGRWSDATGAATVPSSYNHNGQTWQLLQDIPDITADEPMTGAANWQLINDVNMANVRLSKLNNPLCHLFKTNNVVDTLSGVLSSSRASTATYIDRYGTPLLAGVDEIREEKEGFLVEGESTNLFLQSGTLDTAPWTQSNKTVTQVPSEDFGILTPYLSVPDAVSTIHTLAAQSITPAAGDFTATYIVKSKELGIVQFGSTAAWSPSSGLQLCKVDFRDGSVLLGSENITQLEQLANDYWIFSHTFTVDVSVTAAPTCQLYSNADEQVWTPNGTDGIYIAATQVEELPYPTSYIPTGASIESRDADKISCQMANNSANLQNDLSVFFKVKIKGTSPSLRYLWYWESNETVSGTESFFCTVESNLQRLLFRYDDSINENNVRALYDTEDTFSGSCVIEGDNLLAYLDGELVDTEIKTASLTNNVDGTFYIGDPSGTNQFSGHIKDLRVYDNLALNIDENKLLSGG